MAMQYVDVNFVDEKEQHTGYQESCSITGVGGSVEVAMLMPFNF
jgi:hypothetical protein